MDAAALLVASQGADIAPPLNIRSHQSDIAQRDALGHAKQAYVVVVGVVDGQIADGVAQAVERAGESRAVAANGREVRHAAGIYIATQDVFSSQVAAHGLQGRHVLDHGVVVAVDGQ